ncbi:MAG: DegV family protein [Coxiellaceae bacterium]|nr:DegV family protein [Coxiellaceae bacterium]
MPNELLRANQSDSIHIDEWLIRVKNGAQAVITHHNEINAINVFPVADHDTGSNLASLMRGILTVEISNDFDGLSQSIRMAALRNARGNSGGIMAQFLCHFVPNKKNRSITTMDWINLFQGAVAAAVNAVEDPAAGTMLTVMQAVSTFMSKADNTTNKLTQILSNCLPVTKKALTKTTQQNAALRQSAVVDAGALGFYYFLKGMIQNTPTEFCVTATEALGNDQHNITDEPAYRYCTELLIHKCNHSAQQLKSLLSDQGNSVVVTGDKDSYRLHVHTNNPIPLIKSIIKIAALMDNKIDDMWMQYTVSNMPKRHIALVTDSIADIPNDLLDKYLIHVIPVEILIGNINLQDKICTNSEMIYTALQQEKVVKSASPTDHAIQTRLGWLAKNFDHILCITVAKTQSGTFDKMKRIANQLAIDCRVIDSRRNSAALGLIVLRAAKMIKQALTIDEIVQTLESEHARENVNIIVAVNNIQAMIKSGRVNHLSGLLINALRLKPLVTLDNSGKGKLCAKAWGFNSALKHLVKLVVEKKPTVYAISHASCIENANQLSKRLKAALGFPPLYIIEVSTAVVLHAGIGCVAVSYDTN